MTNARVMNVVALMLCTSVQVGAQHIRRPIDHTPIEVDDVQWRAAVAQRVSPAPNFPTTLGRVSVPSATLMGTAGNSVRTTGFGCMLRSGPGRALVDGIAVGGFVFAVTNLAGSDGAVKSGVIGGGVVTIAELLWQRLGPRPKAPLDSVKGSSPSTCTPKEGT